ncbi:hypothetical protein VP01_729g2 [Puccinia sorghi]|uniref:Uncharacterized protein n=1 Tax=Puccinia sorghi TaxID=27349 RepID=A0A0L6UDV5_9BASI|nr:hypothetical protein VP01_729g2 [Puccinia sorghi]
MITSSSCNDCPVHVTILSQYLCNVLLELSQSPHTHTHTYTFFLAGPFSHPQIFWTNYNLAKKKKKKMGIIPSLIIMTCKKRKKKKVNDAERWYFDSWRALRVNSANGVWHCRALGPTTNQFVWVERGKPSETPKPSNRPFVRSLSLNHADCSTPYTYISDKLWILCRPVSGYMHKPVGFFFFFFSFFFLTIHDTQGLFFFFFASHKFDVDIYSPYKDYCIFFKWIQAPIDTSVVDILRFVFFHHHFFFFFFFLNVQKKMIRGYTRVSFFFFFVRKNGDVSGQFHQQKFEKIKMFLLRLKKKKKKLILNTNIIITGVDSHGQLTNPSVTIHTRQTQTQITHPHNQAHTQRKNVHDGHGHAKKKKKRSTSVHKSEQKTKKQTNNPPPPYRKKEEE